VSEPPPELELHTGWVADELAAEHPGLRLCWLDVAARPGPSPPGVAQRLARMSDRFRGAQAVALRRQPIPWAYRVFYRHVGLDPDIDRTPIEAAAVRRLLDGAFRSRHRLHDALLIGLLETGVPIWALDADTVEGALGIRAAESAERLGRGADASPLPPGALVVADERGALARLFDEPAAEHGAGVVTPHVRVFSVQVPAVPDIHVEEAMFSCAALLRED
jgi:DNA/RNA-binding domain of Phe-tRNA-synthetase-like protein